MKPWMIAALLGALFGLTSRRWLSIDAGRGQTFRPSALSQVHVHIIIGLGNRIIYYPDPSLSASQQESPHAEGA